MECNAGADLRSCHSTTLFMSSENQSANIEATMGQIFVFSAFGMIPQTGHSRHSTITTCLDQLLWQ